jgi:hypothetical protein
MIDDKARRTLRQTAKRGGAVSAGAIVVLLAGGSFALGSSGVDEAATAAPGLTGAAGSAGSAVSGVLPQPAPQASPGVGGLVDTVTDTVGDVGDTVDGLVNGEPTPEPTETITVPPKPGPGTKPPGVKPKPKPKPVTGAHTRAVAPTHVRVAHNARPGAAAGFRDRSGLDSVGSFGEQRANASVTPRLAPGSFDGLIAAPDLGSRGVPGVLVVIATAGVAALGASHLGIWYNRRSLSTS